MFGEPIRTEVQDTQDICEPHQDESSGHPGYLRPPSGSLGGEEPGCVKKNI